jgi:hypothetical protein
MEQRAAQIDQRAMAEAATRKQADAEEKQARESVDAQLATRLELTATGGLRLSGVGLVWLIVGTILVGFSGELASHLQPVYGGGGIGGIAEEVD